MRNIIYWNNFKRTYAFGSQIEVQGEESVFFENHLLTSGQVLATWVMQANYQIERNEPQLPLLYPGHSYRLHLIAQTWPAASVYMRIIFKDINGHVLKRQVIRGFDGNFTYPKTAHEYQVELLAAGCYKLHFKRLEIEEYGLTVGDDDYLFSGVINNNEQTAVLNVIFTEPLARLQAELTYEGLLDRVTNCLVINSTLSNAKFYLDDKVKAKLQELVKTYQHVNLISYGPVTNLTTWYYGRYFGKKVTVYGTNDFYSLKRYQKLFREYLHEMFAVDTDLLVARLEKLPKKAARTDLDLVKPLFNLETKLLAFPMFRKGEA
ncbi:accessory Sec system protein Asp3 [Ligilactobacillus agilis]|uniref:Accessory Sec system protein Asp3 n=1 Tax=Ligilactobacillus agilis TaxID=1601 RepID=A0A9Q9J9G2_9LACO|nr:accessory Sec system protein Asp3 [Ligilactobacillus agilis]MBL1056760.1 accessory Sec system protein Asp3 [Ligilactobacillus agilis]UXC63540.1 accessory Sec system protein Asp3 [Ligilactobacillus agilis]UXC65538.1 accessory Sec system protein Asp3 [Ligilactobacillus agilis]